MLKKQRTKIGSKVLKLIVFFGIIGKVLWDDWSSSSTANLESLQPVVILVVIAYLLITIYFAASRLLGNYLIGLFALLGITILGSRGETMLIESGFSEDSFFYLFLALGTLLIVYDLWKVMGHFRTSRKYSYSPTDNTLLPRQTESNFFKQTIKEDPQLFLDMSNQLELILKRKPTAEEVMKYVDSLEIEDHGLISELMGK